MAKLPKVIIAKRILAALVLLTGMVTSGRAQAGDDNQHYSVGGEYTGGIGDRTRAFGDLVYEVIEFSEVVAGKHQRISATGGLSYDLGQRTRIEGGLGLYNTYRSEYQDTFGADLWQAATFDWPEHKSKKRRYSFHHRFRLDERFSKTDAWSFAMRLRYRLTFTFPINGYTVSPGVFYIPLKAELYMPLGNNEEVFIAKQANLSAGLGYVFNKTWSMDLKYAWFHLRDTIDADFKTTDQYLELRIKSSFRVEDLIKSR